MRTLAVRVCFEMGRAGIAPLATTEHSFTGEKLSLLAIFAHPEDESFGPAGTLAKYASEGVQVSLVTATRGSSPSPEEINHLKPEDMAVGERERLCSCRTTGVRRVCFFDNRPGQLHLLDPIALEDHMVRLIRETQPQVLMTFGPEGPSADRDHEVVDRAVRAAFRDAGDTSKFRNHFREGLCAHTPLKLYHCVLPSSLADEWGVSNLSTVPDNQVTTVLDVSAYGEAMRNALFCQRSHELDFIRWLADEQRIQWDHEYYSLVNSRLNRKTKKENDLFAGLR